MRTIYTQFNIPHDLNRPEDLQCKVILESTLAVAIHTIRPSGMRRLAVELGGKPCIVQLLSKATRYFTNRRGAVLQ